MRRRGDGVRAALPTPSTREYVRKRRRREACDTAMHRQVFSHEHAVRHVLNHGRRSRAVLEPNRVPDLLAQITSKFFRDALRHGHRRDAARLRAADHACAEHRRGPRRLKIEKETTPGIVRWTRVASMA